jgi:hypothetical protein
MSSDLGSYVGPILLQALEEVKHRQSAEQWILSGAKSRSGCNQNEKPRQPECSFSFHPISSKKFL